MAKRNPLDELPPGVKARLRKIDQPNWVAPMLATLTEERFSRPGWLFEPKWDGERCLAFRDGRHLRLLSRNRKQLNEKYPEITAALRRQEMNSFIADGEIVAFKKNGVTSFAELQRRMQIAHPLADLLLSVPVRFFLFDLLYLEHYDTRRVPLRYRKELLRHALDFRNELQFTEHRETEGEAYYREACRKGWEGVIAKNGESAYVSNERATGSSSSASKSRSLSLAVTPIRAESESALRSLARGFLPSRQAYVRRQGRHRLRYRHPATSWPEARATGDGRQPVCRRWAPRRGAHWVKPQLVAQIAFTEWTPGRKAASSPGSSV